MNNVQKIVSDISGYDPEETGARCDYYYDECSTLFEKLDQIQEYAENSSGFSLTLEETCKAYEFLEREFSSAGEMNYAFNDL